MIWGGLICPVESFRAQTNGSLLDNKPLSFLSLQGDFVLSIFYTSSIYSPGLQNYRLVATLILQVQHHCFKIDQGRKRPDFGPIFFISIRQHHAEIYPCYDFCSEYRAEIDSFWKNFWFAKAIFECSIYM